MGFSDKALALSQRTGITTAVETVLAKVRLHSSSFLLILPKSLCGLQAESVDQSITGGKGKNLVGYATNLAATAIDTARNVMSAYKTRREGEEAEEPVDVDGKTTD